LEKTESGYRFQVPLVQNYVEQVIEEEDWAIARLVSFVVGAGLGNTFWFHR
jgi:hypothetical protein